MKHTSLIYDPQSGWRVGSFRLTTDKSTRVSSENARDAMAWMYPVESDDHNIPAADDLMADTKDKIPRILYDDDGQLIVAMPANSRDDKPREKIKIDSPDGLAMAMNLHMMARLGGDALGELSRKGLVDALKKAKPFEHQ